MYKSRVICLNDFLFILFIFIYFLLRFILEPGSLVSKQEI